MAKKRKTNKKRVFIFIVLLVLIVVGLVFLFDYLKRNSIKKEATSLIKKYESEYNGTNYIKLDNATIELSDSGKVVYMKYKSGKYCYSKVEENENITKSDCIINVANILSDDKCLKENCEVGTEVVVNVNEDEKYTFYVIDNSNDKLTLYMKDTIGYKVSYDEALSYLNLITANWTYIDRINSYEYKNTGIMYSNFKINNGKTTIDEKEVSGTSRARLITKDELINLGCSNLYESCPKWLYSSLSSSNTNKNPYGVWTITTSNSVSNYVFTLFYTGNIDTNVSTNKYSYGIRPVIELKKN